MMNVEHFNFETIGFRADYHGRFTESYFRFRSGFCSLMVVGLCLSICASAYAQRRRPIVPVSSPPVISTHQRLRELASSHPICVVVGEGLASKFIETETRDEGPFEEYVMGAYVQGTQKTKALTSLDFTPDANAARMLFVLKGVTANQTLAKLPQAAIRSAGTFEFELNKQIEFNGKSIRTWSPSAFMTVHQRNLGASTPVSNIPLLGPLANNIVLNAAEQRKPMSEGIAAQRVTDQVAPQFNSRLDQQLAEFNKSLQGPLKTRAIESHLYPSQISSLTTDDAALVGLDFQASVSAADASGQQPLGVHRPSTTLITRQLIPDKEQINAFSPGLSAPAPYSLDANTLRDRACCLIHVSLVRELTERFQLAGREIPDTRLMQILGVPLPAEASAKEPQLYTVILARQEPVSVVVDDGEALISVRVAFRTVIGLELPTQVIQIAVRPKLTNQQILLKPELRSIEPLQVGEKGQIGSTAMTLIRQGIEKQLKEFTINRDYEIPRQNGRTSFPVRIQNLTLVDGWITLTLAQCDPSGLSTSVGTIKAEKFLR